MKIVAVRNEIYNSMKKDRSYMLLQTATEDKL